MPKPAAKARPQGRLQAPSPPSPLVSEILAGVAAIRKGPAGWFEKIPADAQAELIELRDRFRSGTLACTKTGLAKSIHTALVGRDVLQVGWREVERWLGGR